MPPSSSTRRGIAIFAHNEEAHIRSTLEAVRQAGLGTQDEIHVLINGSSDATERIARQEAAQDPRIRPAVIALGDKSNAWNVYTHRLAPHDAGVHVFIDGDVTPSAGSLPAIDRALAAHPGALAAATMPTGGRTAEPWAERVRNKQGMPGNFYAIRGSVLERMRDHPIWLPVGLIGDDPVLRWLFLRELDPKAPPGQGRIVAVTEASFSYQSIAQNSLAGIRALFKRQMRYSLRDMQCNLLFEALRREGLSALPRRIDALYSGASPLSPLPGAIKLRKAAFLYTWLRAQSLAGKPFKAPTWEDDTVLSRYGGKA